VPYVDICIALYIGFCRRNKDKNSVIAINYAVALAPLSLCVPSPLYFYLHLKPDVTI